MRCALSPGPPYLGKVCRVIMVSVELDGAVDDRIRSDRKVLAFLACKDVAATMRRRIELRGRAILQLLFVTGIAERGSEFPRFRQLAGMAPSAQADNTRL